MKKIFLITLYLFVAVLSFSQSAFCISAKDIFHNPPDVRSFKAPGIPLLLKAKLNGTRNVNHKVKLLAVIDGKVLDVPSNQVYWDEYDRPVYDFEIYYPKRTLNYVFIIDEYEDLGRIKRTMTRKFVVNRACELPSKSEATDNLQRIFEDANIEEKNELVLDETHKLLEWFKKRVANDEEK